MGVISLLPVYLGGGGGGAYKRRELNRGSRYLQIYHVNYLGYRAS